MRVVVDSNVFVRGSVFEDSDERAVLRSVKKSALTILITIPILDEIFSAIIAVSTEHNRDTYHALQELMRTVAAAVLIQPTKEIARSFQGRVPDDEEDEKFLLCAHAGDADYIVSNDGHLLNIDKRFKTVAGRTIAVIRPYDFVRMMLLKQVQERRQ